MADYQVVVKPFITREMVQVLPSVITDKITLPDVVEDIKNPEGDSKTSSIKQNSSIKKINYESF